ncbi:SEC14 cytosolic factor [Thraustotheca clavata]|uniref:SEC14 cytosolic factor n=1 Tax=Thraustotheca clavata TaxID=74557 RepID=A0A1W0A2Y2_9STRA|nr:SEC14 cytosolic factor [Thraustotheca clavata]
MNEASERSSSYVLQRQNSSSSTLISRSNASFRGALPGMFEGRFLGILASGVVDKRREGAVRAGFARRLFLLSVRGLHYYRKSDEHEMFGTERGQMSLKDVGYAKVVLEEEAPYGTVEAGIDSYFFGIFSKQHVLTWFMRVESLENAKYWVTAINAALEIGKKKAFPNEWTPDMLEQFTKIVVGMPMSPEYPEQATPISSTSSSSQSRVFNNNVQPIILGLSVSTPGGRERLITRKLELEKDILLGPIALGLKAKDSCYFIMNNQDIVVLPHTQLASLATSIETSGRASLDCVIKGNRTMIYVSASATRVMSRAQSSMSITREKPFIPSLLTTTTGFSALYILSCGIALFFSPPFQGVMKVTATLGVLLALSVLGTTYFDYSQLVQLVAAEADAETPVVAAAMFQVTLRVSKVVLLNEEDASSPSNQDPEPVEIETEVVVPVSKAPQRPEVIPEISFSPRFIAAEKGDEVKGRARYEATLQWRRENQVDGMLYEVQTHFHTIKSCYPQYFHGRSKNGHCVYYEKIGKIDLKKLKSSGLTLDQLLRHYMYITEYLWLILEPSDTGRTISVLDAEGVGFYDLTGEVMEFVRRAMAFVSAHYPERSAQIFIINVPTWFNVIWKGISPLVDPVTKEKIRICKGKMVKEELLKSIDIEQLPSDYGGHGPPLGQSTEEKALANYAMDELEAMKEELAACEADLVLWKVRLSRAKRNELLKMQSINRTLDVIQSQVLQVPESIPNTNTLELNKQEEELEKKQEVEKKKEEELKKVEDERKRAQERKILLQKLREEKAKAARREKIAELEKAAREALKKQRIAREQLEKANQRVIPPPIRTNTKRQLTTVPRQGKRLQIDTPKAVEMEKMNLPKAQSLPLETPNDLLSHVFRVCTRYLLQRNKMLSVAQLQVVCQDYFGTEFGVAAKSANVLSDFASFLSCFPFFDAVISDYKSTACNSLQGEFFLPKVTCSTPEMLAHFLMASREHINNVLQLTTQISSSKEKEVLLDLFKVSITMYMASPAQSLL